ncbi:MAG TPA: HD domain-containing protein [Ktedonobacterales bacterium]
MAEHDEEMELETAEPSGPLLSAATPDYLTALRRGRGAAFADPLYGVVRVAEWAAALLATPPFQRLAGVSLSNVPGPLLFGHAFPSRLEHSLGAYHLARQARPRDRILQAAALAHDLGHGPFSHLSEPALRECLHMSHEERSGHLLALVRDALSPATLRNLSWLDWEEVARLINGHGSDGRGALLSGTLDFDNIDNVARFKLMADLGEPSYEPVALARALRPSPGASTTDGLVPAALRAHQGAYLLPGHTEPAVAWLRDREIVYGFLHTTHHNLVCNAMLRASIDSALATGYLDAAFFALTDAEALESLASAPDAGVAMLAGLARARAFYECVWEGECAPHVEALAHTLGAREARTALRRRLAAEAGLAPHEVVIAAQLSSAWRALPPVARGASLEPIVLPQPDDTPRLLHVFCAPGAPADYVHRLRLAASRLLRPLGVTAVEYPSLPVASW